MDMNQRVDPNNLFTPPDKTLIKNCHKNIGPGARSIARLVQRYESNQEVLGIKFGFDSI